MIDFDDKFVDVDFPEHEEFVFGDLGRPKDEELFGRYEDAEPLMSWGEIDAEIEQIEAEDSGADQLVTRIYNQKSEGSCTANAIGSGIESLQALQLGKDKVVPLSAISLYKRIGRSPRSGSVISDGIKEMQERGILPLDTPKNRETFGSSVMPNTGFYEKFPGNWESTGKHFLLLEAYVIRNTQELFTALCKRHPVIVGRDGHAIRYATPVKYRSDRAVKYANSWGRWGGPGGDFEYGFGIDTVRQFTSAARYAFALRSMVLRKAA